MRAAGFSPRFRWLTITDGPSAWRKPFAIEVATFLTEGAKDPRIVGFVTVTGVEVTHDLRHAKVFVSVLGTEAEQKRTLEGLASLAGHSRSRARQVARAALRAGDRVPPRPSVERAARIETLLAQVKSEKLELGGSDGRRDRR